MYIAYSVQGRRLQREFVEKDAICALEKVIDLVYGRPEQNFYLVSGDVWVQYRWSDEESNVAIRRVEAKVAGC